jgi:flagellar basal-body rod modification protein FlgD
MASSISPITNASTASSTASSGGAAPPTQEMFLKLLVSQLQNQDPLNPTDSTQFVSQLAQISELEQVIGIRGDIETQMSKPPASTAGTTPATSPATLPPNPAAAPSTIPGQVPASSKIQL